MAALQEAYFPVYLDSELGTYRFADDFSFKKIDLTKNEIRALLASGPRCRNSVLEFTAPLTTF